MDDPFDDIKGMNVPSRSPSPIVARTGNYLDGGDVDEYLEDEVDIEALAKEKTEEEI